MDLCIILKFAVVYFMKNLCEIYQRHKCRQSGNRAAKDKMCIRDRDPTQSRGWILHFGLERVGFCTKSGSDFAFWEEKGIICKIWGSSFCGIKKD